MIKQLFDLGEAPQAKGPLPPDWYEKISTAWQELERAGEQRQQQTLLWLMPSPSKEKH